MKNQEVQNIASQSLNALSDNRVMLPADSLEAVASLKNILRSLITGQHVLVPAPAPDEADK